MGEKRFRTRTQWNNTRLALYAAPFFLLSGLFIGVATGRYEALIALCIVIATLFIVGVIRDRPTRIYYQISGDQLVLVRGQQRVSIPASDIIDASLMDRAAARDYFRSRLLRSGVARVRAGRAFLRYCTVDIGLRTFTFGLGRGLIDRMPDARHDMLMLRLKHGNDLLLSPEYNQDMLESIARMLRRSSERASETTNRDQ